MPFGSKTDGREVTVGGKKYTYSATEGAWLRSGVIDSTNISVSTLNVSGNLEADSLTIGGQDWNANRAAAETSIENTKTAAETYINNAASTAESNLAAQISTQNTTVTNQLAQHSADVATAIAGVITDVVEDTSPQLGGNLDLNSRNITGTGNISITGSITASGDIVSNSDRRLKDNIQPITHALDTVKSLQGKAYIKDNKASLGLIAQEVEEVLPMMVHTADDEMGTKSVNYQNMVAVLIEAVKELSAKVEELENNNGV